MKNVTIKDAQILTNNKMMKNGAYIKTWVGELVPQDDYESDYEPRGGGWCVSSSSLLFLFTLLTDNPGAT